MPMSSRKEREAASLTDLPDDLLDHILVENLDEIEAR
jgi:hypothetical protein